MRLANTDAPINNQRDPDTLQRPPVAYVEPTRPAELVNPINSAITRSGGLEPTPQPFRSSGTETRPARRAVAYFSRVTEGFRLRRGDTANGLHAVIARQASGMPVGQQASWPKQQRSTLFRPPDPWDAGAVRATPGGSAAA